MPEYAYKERKQKHHIDNEFFCSQKINCSQCSSKVFTLHV